MIKAERKPLREKENIMRKVRMSDKRGYLAAKRCFDILFSLTMGAVLMLPMLVIAGLIRLDSPGEGSVPAGAAGRERKTIYHV